MSDERRVGPIGDFNGHCSDGEAGHPLGLLRVAVRMGNYSAFNGYRFTPSDYSQVVCQCGAWWRTKAAYVSLIPNERSNVI